MPNQNVCASRKALMQGLNIDAETADKIRKAWKTDSKAELFALVPSAETYDKTYYHPATFREKKRYAIDCLLETHGVEYLGKYKPNGADVYYCNAGDTYTTTIVFIGHRLIVSCWGDLVEKNQIREPEQF
jgi:hypothetical protein